MTKTIIAGCRNFTDRELLFSIMDAELPRPELVISGAAPGADTLGEQWATARGIAIKRFPAEWAKYGKAAGMKRNAEMAAYGNRLVAFWDGKSRDTGGMIKIAQRLCIPVHVITLTL